MNGAMTFKIHVVRGRPGQLAELREGAAPPKPVRGPRPARVARLVAVAHHVENLVRSGEMRDYAAVARLAGITRGRASQIINLLLLAPDIQETLLFMERQPDQGRDPVTEKDLRDIALEPDWRKQREAFSQLLV